MNQRYITILGWVATFTAVCMYVSYIPQISANLSGNKRDYPVALANAPGVILGFLKFIANKDNKDHPIIHEFLTIANKSKLRKKY